MIHSEEWIMIQGEREYVYIYFSRLSSQLKRLGTCPKKIFFPLQGFYNALKLFTSMSRASFVQFDA